MAEPENHINPGNNNIMDRQADILYAAAVSYAVYNNNIPKGMIKLAEYKSGALKAVSYRSIETGKVFVAYRGSSNATNWLFQNPPFLIGVFANVFKNFAADITGKIIAEHGRENIIFTGHSLGGTLAAYSGLNHGLSIIGFDIPDMGFKQPYKKDHPNWQNAIILQTNSVLSGQQYKIVSGATVLDLHVSNNPFSAHKMKNILSTLRNGGLATAEAKHILSGFGYTIDNFNALDPTVRNKIETLVENIYWQREWNNQVIQIKQMYSGLVEIGNTTNNDKLTQIGTRGQSIITLLDAINGVRPEGVSFIKPAMQIFTSISISLNPYVALMTAVTGLLAAFGVKFGNKDNFNADLMNRLKGISQQIEELHQDMIQGFNFLIEEQRNVCKEILGKIHNLKFFISNENIKWSLPLLSSVSRIEEHLSLIHHDLSTQVSHVYLQDFKHLGLLLEEAVLPNTPVSTRRMLLQKWSYTKIVQLENWIIHESTAGMLNGYRYINLLQQKKKITDPDSFLNTRLFDPDNLGYFVAYLAGLVLHLGLVNTSELSEDEHKICKESSNIANPDFWLQSTKIYIPLRQSLIEAEIEHDCQNLKLNKILARIESYIKFIQLLQKHSITIFDRLLELHDTSIRNVEDKVQRIHFNDIATNPEYSLTERNFFNNQIEYSFNRDFIQNCSRTDSFEPTLNQFLDYRNFIEIEVQNIYWNFLSNFRQLLNGLLNNQEFNTLLDFFDKPLVPIARHKKGTTRGQSYLEPNHNSYNPFFRFEDFGFKIPMSLKQLFDNDANLRNKIPKVCYIAELLGLGNFQIEFTTQYSPPGRSNYSDPAHIELNDTTKYFTYEGQGFYNYDYRFEMFFTGTETPKRICKFSCYAEQVPVSPEILNVAALLGEMGKYRSGQDGCPAPTTIYMHNASIQTKICTFNQVKHFTMTNTLEVFNQEVIDLETQLRPVVEQRLQQLKHTYYDLYKLPNNQVLLADDFNKIDSAKNLILSFMHLCGFSEEQIEMVQPIWAGEDLIMNSANLLNEAHGLQIEAYRQARPQSIGLEENDVGIDFDLVQANTDAKQALKDIVRAKQALDDIVRDNQPLEDMVRNNDHQSESGYRIAEIDLTNDLLGNLLLLEDFSEIAQW